MDENTPISESEAPAEAAAEVVSTPTEVAVEAPGTSDDVWNEPMNLTAEEDSPEGEEQVPEVKPETPEADEKTEATEEVATDTPEADEEDDESLESPTDKPAPLSRRKLREIEDKLITPIRNPDAPISDVWQGLIDVNPKRAEDLAVAIAEASAQQHPDLWLERITGIEGVTVESVKQKFSGVEPTQADDGLSEVVKHLDAIYDGSWKDPSRDSEVLEEDLPYVRAIRAQLDKASQETGKLTEKDAEIQKLQDELQSLKPEIEGIKSQQEAEYELRVATAKDTAVNEFTSDIEKRSLPSLFEQSGLKVSDSDTPAIKSGKEYVQGLFKSQDGFMSPFEQYAVTQFSDKENLSQIISRVDKYLDEAAKAEVKAAQVKGAKADELKRTAEARRADAKSEQARLVVLHKKAAAEFVQKIPFMSVLEENADLQRRLGLRQEIVGQTSVAANTNAWKEAIDNSDDPWKGASIADRVAQAGR